MNKTIYLAEDETTIRVAITAFLEKEGYIVQAFENGDLLFDAFNVEASDLVILDVMMPGSSGLVICTKIRAASNVPIIILTARGSDEDYTTGISLGADDYLTKPFSPVKLVMRVKALFRRLEMETPSTTAAISNEHTYADLTVNADTMKVICSGKELKLTNTELKFLLHLIKNQHKAISRDELLLEIWEHEYAVETRVTDDTVKRLRKKLTAANSQTLIETVWGFGFRIMTKNEG